MTQDLFSNQPQNTPASSSTPSENYTADDIEVLEGLEPVRKRPGMYIGGTDEKAYHHLFAELLDNSMDEAVAGFATKIEVELTLEGFISVKDNGRGIPVDEHPKFPGKSALEVILTTLHSGGKFSNKAYATAGGLHGVGLSVVNALSEKCDIEIARDRKLYEQTYSRGQPLTSLITVGDATHEKGTKITFKPDQEIFGSELHFKADILYKMIRSKAYLYKGVKILWVCDPVLLSQQNLTDKIPAKSTLHFPGGLSDFLKVLLKNNEINSEEIKIFSGHVELQHQAGKVEWAIAWPQEDVESYFSSYCNTIPTPLGGTHELGFRSAILRGIRAYGERKSDKNVGQILADDIFLNSLALLSIYIPHPQFQGQTKEKLVNVEVSKLVDQTIKDHFDHFLSEDPSYSDSLYRLIQERAEDRKKRKQEKELSRKTATRRLRLPGKLADCSQNTSQGTEIFIVEGDSAGGSAKQARLRETQAILPLRGKILNVANATFDKLKSNQELSDLTLALGCGSGKDFDVSKLRYERVIIMTDADVDGAHIASLLMTFFFYQMKGLITNGKLFLAQPPLYRLSQGELIHYARSDDHKNELLEKVFKKDKKLEISRFKGLGEMQPSQLKQTTMDPKQRTLLKVVLEPSPTISSEEGHAEEVPIATFIDHLMGKNPEKRYEFIQSHAHFDVELDI